MALMKFYVVTVILYIGFININVVTRYTVYLCRWNSRKNTIITNDKSIYDVTVKKTWDILNTNT